MKFNKILFLGLAVLLLLSGMLPATTLEVQAEENEELSIKFKEMLLEQQDLMIHENSFLIFEDAFGVSLSLPILDEVFEGSILNDVYITNEPLSDVAFELYKINNDGAGEELIGRTIVTRDETGITGGRYYMHIYFDVYDERFAEEERISIDDCSALLSNSPTNVNGANFTIAR